MKIKLLAICFALALSACTTDSCGNKLAASSFAKAAVTKVLKAPKTAEFANVQAHPDGECLYIVAGRVSAQNSFGAMIENNFSVMVKFQRGSNDYQVYDLLLTD